MTLSAGTKLGPYEIQSTLGAGGMGEVYRARDTRLGRDVAVKVLPVSVASDQERLRRFEQEARSASALNHPNIVTIHDVGQTNGVSWIAMELVDGSSLRQVIAGGALPLKRSLSVGTQIAEGLARAHASGIVHRDLKPENVMVTSDGLVKILDFGLAKASASETADASQVATATQQTEAGVVLGTVGYMSPEQATGRAVDYRSDQFALGAILYEMATGRRAFQGASAVETLSKILRDDPEPLDRVEPGVPESLVWIVQRCLSKEPEERYQSTRDLARDLAGVRDRTGEAVASASRAVAPSRLRSVLWIGTAAVVAAAASFWFGAHRHSRPADARPAEDERSIAVLPFQNVGGRPEDEYFSDGMTDSLITEVAKVNSLLVTARNSAFRYKGAAPDVRKVGEDLGVRYVLEGSVQRAGDSVRVNAQLIDARTGYGLWAEKYDRPMREVFALQDDISKNVVAALKLTLASPAGAAHGPLTPTPRLEAYDAYLRGVFYANAVSWLEKEKSLPYLEQAVALEPNFAAAHAALAWQYARKSFERDPDRRWQEKGFVEIEKALAIDPNLADAYAARGFLSWTLLNHFPHERAAADYRRAIELNPSLGRAHSGLASLYLHVGLLDEALEQYRRALKIDPHDLDALYRIPRIHLYQQKYAEALAGFDAVPDFHNDFQKPLALAHLGRLSEAVAVSREGLTNPAHSTQESDAASTRAVLFALSGDPHGAEDSIAAAVAGGEGSSHFHHAGYNIACAYALSGKRREALAWLRKTSDGGMPCYPLFEKDPFLNNLRGDPAFEAFMHGLRSEWERLREVL